MDNFIEHVVCKVIDMIEVDLYFLLIRSLVLTQSNVDVLMRKVKSLMPMRTFCFPCIFVILF